MPSCTIRAGDFWHVDRLLSELERILPLTWVGPGPTPAPSHERQLQIEEAELNGGIEDVGWALRRGMSAARCLLLAVTCVMSRLFRQMQSWARLRVRAFAVYRRASPLVESKNLVEGAMERFLTVEPSSDDEEVRSAGRVHRAHVQAEHAAAEYFCWLHFCSRAVENGDGPPSRDGFRAYLRGEHREGRYPYRTVLEPVPAVEFGEAFGQFGRSFVEAANDVKKE